MTNLPVLAECYVFGEMLSRADQSEAGFTSYVFTSLPYYKAAERVQVSTAHATFAEY